MYLELRRDAKKVTSGIKSALTWKKIESLVTTDFLILSIQVLYKKKHIQMFMLAVKHSQAADLMIHYTTFYL